jgi:two-component system sensor histidine kinase RpfC
MTHELRTPLTGVVGMTELLRGTALDVEQRDYVQAIGSSAEVLGALIGDILDLSKIDARQLVLECLPFDPRVLVRDVCDALGSGARAAGIELICDLDPTVPHRVLGDQLRVRQILSNLAGNAVKFTEQGQVLVRASVRPADAQPSRPHLLFEILDTGIGIAREKLPRLFERFRQADESTTRRFGGTGLGTTIARELTLMMGGTIGVESEEGTGSRFWIRLPLIEDLPPVPARAQRRLAGSKILLLERNAAYRDVAAGLLRREGADCVALAEPEDVELSECATMPFDLLVIADHPQGRDLVAARAQVMTTLGGSVPCLFLVYPGRRPTHDATPSPCLAKPYLPEDLVAAAEVLVGHTSTRGAGAVTDGTSSAPLGLQPVPNAERCRVLIAEDNEIAAKVITSFLGKMGFALTRVGDGKAALAEALSGGYGIAIVDLRMPELDGIGFAKRYRELAPDRPIPIVALTANASEDIKRDCLSGGMDAFLSKPVRPDELRQVMEAALRALPGADLQPTAIG